MDSKASPVLILPYDNTNGLQTGVAIANKAATSTTITATLRDGRGNTLGSSAGNLTGLGLRFSPLLTFTSISPIR